MRELEAGTVLHGLALPAPPRPRGGRRPWDIYEPDLWPGGRLHNEWVGRGGLSAGAHWSVKDTSKARAICEECGPLGMWAQDEIEAKYAEHAWEHAPSVRYEWENE